MFTDVAWPKRFKVLLPAIPAKTLEGFATHIMNKYPPLLPDSFYHLYNHGIGDELIFRSHDNFQFFISRMKMHLPPVMDVFTYSLLPNHFHLVVRTKPGAVIIREFKNKKGIEYDREKHRLSDFIMTRLGHCLNSYAKSFNKVNKRMGGVFMANTKRTDLQGERGFMNAVLYAHKNAVHHGFTRKIGEWPYDGYNDLLTNRDTWLMRDEIFQRFGSREEFIRIHESLKIESK